MAGRGRRGRHQTVESSERLAAIRLERLSSCRSRCALARSASVRGRGREVAPVDPDSLPAAPLGAADRSRTSRAIGRCTLGTASPVPRARRARSPALSSGRLALGPGCQARVGRGPVATPVQSTDVCNSRILFSKTNALASRHTPRRFPRRGSPRFTPMGSLRRAGRWAGACSSPVAACRTYLWRLVASRAPRRNAAASTGVGPRVAGWPPSGRTREPRPPPPRRVNDHGIGWARGAFPSPALDGRNRRPGSIAPHCAPFHTECPLHGVIRSE